MSSRDALEPTEPAPSSDGSDRSGRTIGGKYLLLRRIGQGGMGVVYEAQHTVIGRRFAIKFLRARWAAGEDSLARFRREAHAAGALESEHVAAVTDFDLTDDGTPYLVMEYLTGESLAELLEREGPLPLARALDLILQACRGLEVAHAAGIVHRDLKPDNLFVTQRADGSDWLKILDFGIAKWLSPEAGATITRTGTMLGTPFYMAPEQARGEKALDQRVDIYALGVILFELLSGQKPHPGDSYNAILAHILTETPLSLSSLRPGLPAELIGLIERVLARTPSARPGSAKELARAIGPFVTRSGVSHDSQFDLRPPRELPRPSVTQPAPDTLSVSEKSTHSAHGTPRTSRVWILLGGCALLGAVALSLKSLSRSEPRTATPVLATATFAVPAAASASAAPTLSSSAAPQPAPVLGVPAASAKRTLKARPKPSQAAPADSSPRVRFDNQNPYD